MNEPQRNVEIVQSLYRAFANRDIAGMLALLSRDVQWGEPENPHNPAGGTRHGHAGFMEWLKIGHAAEEILALETKEFLAGRDAVAVVGFTRCRARSTNREYATDFVHLVTIADGKVSRFQEFFDTFAAAEAFREGPVAPDASPAGAHDASLLDALLDSWDRNHRILVNLLRAIPDDLLDAKPADGSHTIAELFAHAHFVRLVFVEEDAPERARPLPEDEWAPVRDRERMAWMLDESARAVREAVASRLAAGRAMDRHYDHPVLMLQHLIWHEGYHHGQIKLALAAAGRPLPDNEAGPLTWSVWMKKRTT